MQSNNNQEIITIQCGPLSNGVGTHFWNLNSKLNEKEFTDEVFYYISESRRSKITPRLLSIDTKNSIGNAEIVSEVPCDSANILDPQTVSMPVKMSEETPYSWASCLHPIVRNYLKEYDGLHALNSTVRLPWAKPTKTQEDGEAGNRYGARNDGTDFELFAQGQHLFQQHDPIADEIEDTLRRLAEQCNRPSGFSFLTDSENGFAGLTLELGNLLQDEFPKRAVITHAFEMPCPERSNALSIINKAVLFSRLESSEWTSQSAYLPTLLRTPNEFDLCTEYQKAAFNLLNTYSALQLRNYQSFSLQPVEFASIEKLLSSEAYGKRMLFCGGKGYSSDGNRFYNFKPNPFVGTADEVSLSEDHYPVLAFSRGLEQASILEWLSPFDKDYVLPLFEAPQSPIISAKFGHCTGSDEEHIGWLSYYCTAHKCIGIEAMLASLKSASRSATVKQFVDCEDINEIEETFRTNFCSKYN